MQTIFIQVLMAFLGVVGFSVMYNIHGYKIIITGLGGSLSWICYRIIFHFSEGNKILSCFTATLIIALLSEILARILKTPVILFLVPMLVPLVPGSDLYYMMSSLVLQNSSLVKSYAILLAGEAAAIAFGIIIITTLTQTVIRSSQFIRKIRRIRAGE